MSNEYQYDVLVIGAGGAGLRASLELARQGMDVAVVSKVFPTRSHTVAAQGGVNAPLANVTPDNWHWHMFDTVKGSDYLGDQDAIEYMCREAADAVYDLEHDGVPFSRLDDGKIYQRAFGGQSQNFGQEQAARTCAAADRTGHAILHALYQQNLKAKTDFFIEHFAIDLLQGEGGEFCGAVIADIATSEIKIIKAKAVVLATGGWGQIFANGTNALINTGDGPAMALRCGVALQDMEFFQFHPSGISGKGILITEGARGEGGYLLNSENERFMERYAPNVKDLASRDVVSRAIASEIQEGRGCGPNKDFVYLNISHLGEQVINERLPGIRELCLTYANIDPIKDYIPIAPTAHYAMGGVPTNRFGQVLFSSQGRDGEAKEVLSKGLYAVGECACVSVHGANRLGGNSLLDLVVFGKLSAKHIIESRLYESPAIEPTETSLTHALNRFNQICQKKEGVAVSEVNYRMKQTMQKYCGVFRREDTLQQGLDEILEVAKLSDDLRVVDDSHTFNTARFEALELQNLLEVAVATMASALFRKESRGAHMRIDFPERDDENWQKHTLFFKENQAIALKAVRTQPLSVDSFPPKKRVY